MTRHTFTLVSTLAVVGGLAAGSPLQQAAAVLLLVALAVHRLVVTRTTSVHVPARLTRPETQPTVGAVAPALGTTGHLDR